MKIYKIKLNDKVYEVQLEEVVEATGNISMPIVPIEKEPVVSGEGVTVEAPMPGTIVDVKVKIGDAVSAGQLVAVLEAMKMETEILAPAAGTVKGVHCDKGQAVNLGDAIVTLG